MEINIKLPSPDEIKSGIGETYRIENIVDCYFASVSFEKGRVHSINGMAHYTWTQTDYAEPVEYRTVVHWSYFPDTDDWWVMQEAEYVIGPSNEECVKFDVKNVVDYKDLK